MNVPCMECNERKVGCHAYCNQFIQYKKEADRIKEERHKDSRIRSTMFSSRYFYNSKI